MMMMMTMMMMMMLVIVTKGLPKKSPLHRGKDTAFKNAKHTHKHMQTHAHTHKQTNERTNERTNKQTNKQTHKQTNKQFQNTLPPVAENSDDVAAAQGPQKQMDAKNNTIKTQAKTKQPPPPKKTNKQLGTAHREISPCWPTPRLRRSPRTPEQQRVRRKDPPKKRKCYSDLKVSNRPQTLYN